MLAQFLDRLTPRAPHTRLLTAAHVWSGLGIFLAAKGLYLDREASLPIIALTAAVGLGLGLLKAVLSLTRSQTESSPISGGNLHGPAWVGFSPSRTGGSSP